MSFRDEFSMFLEKWREQEKRSKNVLGLSFLGFCSENKVNLKRGVFERYSG